MFKASFISISDRINISSKLALFNATSFKTWIRDSKADVSSKFGSSVVAPINRIVPFSMWGKKLSCCVLLKWWIFFKSQAEVAYSVDGEERSSKKILEWGSERNYPISVEIHFCEFIHSIRLQISNIVIDLIDSRVEISLDHIWVS